MNVRIELDRSTHLQLKELALKEDALQGEIIAKLIREKYLTQGQKVAS